MAPTVDVCIILYNSKPLIPKLIKGLTRISIPVTVYFLDNDSTDGSAAAIAEAIPGLPFRAYILRSSRNNGFARGMNLLFRQGRGEFVYILNPDTEMAAECVERLLARMQSDAGVGICEARQSPREHPKWSDPQTGETSWCTGAATLFRRRAFEEAGAFDERLFFMYCEDVDLSWKFWLKGWKCVYLRDAVVEHYTQDLLPGKRRTRENYYVFRNSLFLFYRFGSWSQRSVLWNFLLQRFLSRRYSFKSKILFAIAFIDHIRYIPYLLQTRGNWNGHRNPWIRFDQTSLAG